MPRALRTGQVESTSDQEESCLWVLAIGVDHYKDPDLGALRYAGRDSQAIAEVLRRLEGGFNKQSVSVLGGELKPPQRAEVIQDFKELVLNAKPEDTVLIYFSGHGVLAPNGHEVFLCLYDTKLDSLAQTGLSITEMLTQLTGCKARGKLLWLDACHSGAGIHAPTKTDSLSDAAAGLVALLEARTRQNQGFYAILSCAANECSWEFPELGHGVFTHFLMEGLQGKAANERGMIDLDGLYRYVYYQTLRYIDQANQQLRMINRQKRRLSESGGEFFREYSLQTPTRFVGGVADVVLGVKQILSEEVDLRTALVMDGLNNRRHSLQLSRELARIGGYSVQYWPMPSEAESCRQVLERYLLQGLTWQRPMVMICLRGTIERTGEGDLHLLMEDGLPISLLWLGQQLRTSIAPRQMFVFDWEVENADLESVKLWLWEQQNQKNTCQCLIAALSNSAHSEKFAQALVRTLEQSRGGLSAADWIVKLSEETGMGVQIETILAQVEGVLEIFPERQARTEDLGVCPYLGLRPFPQEASVHFFGRNLLVRRLLKRLQEQPFIALVGATSSGKTSLLQAGVLAQLREGTQIPGSRKWRMCLIQPGSQPLESLVSGLSNGNPVERGKLEIVMRQGSESFVRWLRSQNSPVVLLIVDQMEEFFLLSPQEERKRFLEILEASLKHAPDRFRLIFSLRSGCGNLPLSSGFQRWLELSTVYLPAKLTESDYRDIILQPALQVGLRVEPELVEVLLRDLEQASGELALLEFVLEQLWEQRKQGRLTLQVYRDQLGGLEGALGQKAEEVLQGLSPKARQCARWLFTLLAYQIQNHPDRGLRIQRAELADPRFSQKLVDTTLEAFASARLLILSADGKFPDQTNSTVDLPFLLQQGQTIEIAHHLILSSWKTLQLWLKEDTPYLRLQGQIEESARAWVEHARDPEYLLSGSLLVQAEQTLTPLNEQLSDQCRTFLNKSLTARNERSCLRQKLKRSRWVIAALAALALGAACFSTSQLILHP